MTATTGESTSAQMRAAGRAARRALPPDEHARASDTIVRRFLATPEFMRARSIACYLSMSDEVETAAVFERAWTARKRIFAPVVVRGSRMRFVEVRRHTRLEKNRYGIWEPRNKSTIAARDLDVVVTPVVAFDAQNRRIGMGGGYYDRSFSFLRVRRTWLRPKLVGFAFACQEVGEISPNSWDIPLSRIITERF